MRPTALAAFGAALSSALAGCDPSVRIHAEARADAVSFALASPLPSARLTPAPSPAALSTSFGLPSDGALAGAAKLADGPHVRVLYPDNAFAAAETVRQLSLALDTAYERLPAGTPPVFVGDLSSAWGGPLSPHRSHQNGRDVDLGYFRRDPESWWADATPRTLDVARTWILVRALVTASDVEVIFVDRSLQRVLHDHARASGEDRAWVDGLFEVSGASRPLVRHEPEHRNHLHVRFYAPDAQRRGRDDFVGKGLPRPPAVVVPPRRLPPG